MLCYNGRCKVESVDIFMCAD